MTQLRNIFAFFGGRSRDQRFRAPIIASGATVGFTILLIASMVYLSAMQSDNLSRERLHKVVELALNKRIEKIPYDQESVAIWDDAVKR